MIGSIFGIAVAMSTLGWWHDNTHLGRPIATVAPYPAAMADDVNRPGFNGRLWVSRPIIGGMQGPYPNGDSAEAESYGDFGNENATVYARVGSLAVGINAFHPAGEHEGFQNFGYRRFEEARNFWLKENGLVGGVRTFVNDAYMYKAAAPESHADATPTRAGKIEPRASFQLPADMPRRGNRLRVDAGSNVNGAAAVVKFEQGWARVSWPDSAPADAVARTEANGGMIRLGSDAPKTAVAAR